MTEIVSEPLLVTYAARAESIGTGSAGGGFFLHAESASGSAARYKSRVKVRSAIMLAAAVYAPCVAHANGRFPRAQQIVSTPNDPSRIFLRATFGVVASFDSGTSWRWLCEDAIGFSGTWDPPLAATPDGRLWMGLEHGLSWTTDACTVHAMPELSGELVSDLSADGGDVVLVTSTPSKPAALWRITRGAAKKTGASVDGFTLDTIDALGARVYVTGVRSGERPTPHLFRSDDGGATLRELHPTWPADGRVYLAAIDPKNAAHVLVRALSERGSDLLASDDAGATFKVALHMAGAMFGFAQSADGATVWAGSGDSDEGLQRSVDRGRTFAPVAKAPIFCLHAMKGKLLSCSNPFTEHGYAIGVSNDDGATLTPLIGFSDILGPTLCDAGAGAGCGKNWTAMHATLTTQTSAPMPSASAPLATPNDAGATAAPARSSCGCRAAPSDSAGAWPAMMALLALIARRVRSRARARPGSKANQQPEPPSPVRRRNTA